MAPTGTAGQNEKAANPATGQYMQATDSAAGRLGTSSNPYVGQPGTAPNQPSNAPAEMGAGGQMTGSQPVPQQAQKPRADWERQLWNQNEQKEDERE